MQGPPLGELTVDCGAMCMPGAAEGIQSLVDDAVAKGAKVQRGRTLVSPGLTVAAPSAAADCCARSEATAIVRER